MGRKGEKNGKKEGGRGERKKGRGGEEPALPIKKSFLCSWSVCLSVCHTRELCSNG